VNASERSNAGVLAAIVLAGMVGTNFTGRLVQAAQPGTETKGPPEMSPLTDKTLVAWVYLANTTQRGGGVLTIQGDADAFDSITFGELAPEKWMAGSDHFRRTQQDQSAYRAETAGPAALVQIAVAYHGNQITIYRNAQRYAGYKIQRPQSFGGRYAVLLGLRYMGSGGQQGYFAGAVEEARIYDVALDAKAIADLAPGKPSHPRPMGQWTFEGGTANDSQGAFPPGELCGGARIANGRLHLNGTDAFMVSEPVIPDNQVMFFKPKSRATGRLWDNWLYYHQGTHYLYCLSGPHVRWHGISLATSPDGVHWREHGLVLRKSEGVTWMGTGHTWKSPNFDKDGKFFMNFSEWKGARQTIFFAQSTDLMRWTRLGNEYEFKQDTRWYQENGRWDCIFAVPRPGGGYYGYWTANPKTHVGFGFGETRDGVSWRALPPPKIDFGPVDPSPHFEVGAVWKIGRMYYNLVHGYSNWRMWTLVADNPAGPFRPAKKNYCVMGGSSTCFTRFYPTNPDGLLVSHYAWNRDFRNVYFAPLKSAVVDDEGTLRLGWWRGNEKMKHQAVDVKPPIPSADSRIAMLENTFDPQQGMILEGTLFLPKTKDAPRRGLYIECAQGTGSAVLFDCQGVAELGPIKAEGSGFRMEKRVDREMQFGTPARFRLLLKGSLMEFYLDDILIECFNLPATATGRIGCIGKVTDLRAWQCD